MYGQTPLHYAAAYDLLEILKLLLQKGADASLEDYGGHTALDIAINYYRSEKEIIKMLAIAEFLQEKITL